LPSYDSQTRHAGHQNGLEVDIRYLPNDRTAAPLNIRDNPADYDTLATFDLMTCFLANARLDLIYADSAALGFWNYTGVTILHNLTGHSDHFHVRILHP